MKCKGLPQHRSGNIIAMIGATEYGVIGDIWGRNECVFDIDFDDREDGDDEDDGKEERMGSDGEVVSISYDWNGYLYKNDTMLTSTEHSWSVMDEVTVIVDLQE